MLLKSKNDIETGDNHIAEFTIKKERLLKMYKSFFKMKYPVKERTCDSWRRYEEIYKLTAELVGNHKALPARYLSLKKCWKRLAFFWEYYSRETGNPNLMFETFYHICFRKFSKKIHGPTEKRLIILIENELLCFSLAFKIWLRTNCFQDAYCAITTLFTINVTDSKNYDGDMRLYLTHRVVKLVMMKDLSREKWTNLFSEVSRYMQSVVWRIYDYVDAYEEAVHFLIPNSYSWYEEWSDRTVLLTSIKQLYNVDFSDDIKGLDALINAIKYRNDTIICTRYLHQTKACSIKLLQHLWGDNYVEKLQCGFLYLCRRYRATQQKKLSSRSRYESTNFTSHWIYTQLAIWCCDESIGLDKSIKKKIFNISMGR